MVLQLVQVLKLVVDESEYFDAFSELVQVDGGLVEVFYLNFEALVFLFDGLDEGFLVGADDGLLAEGVEELEANGVAVKELLVEVGAV